MFGDVLGPVRTFSDAFGHIRMLSEAFGRFRKIVKISKIMYINGTSVWIAPPEMDGPGAGVGNGVGLGAV